MIKKIAIGLLVILILLFPFNKFEYIKDQIGTVLVTKINRQSLLLSYGKFFTNGLYTNWITLPNSYINPHYVASSPFNDGYFDLYLETRKDTVIFYKGTFCEYKNLNQKLQLIDVPNAYGEINWMKISSDTTGRYKHIH